MIAPSSRGDSFAKLVYELSKLPGVGERSATRLAYFMIRKQDGYPEALASAILKAREKMGLCQVCFTFTDEPTCSVCSSSDRDRSAICVVEKPLDVSTFERAGIHKGLYHVLHGVLAPIDGVGPDDLKIEELKSRVYESHGRIKEVILAINPSVEGEATSSYVADQLRASGVKLTKLAHGLPAGAVIEFSDRETLSRALQYRFEVLP